MAIKTKKKSPVFEPSRKIPPLARLILFVQAGGHCEFDGCPAYLLEHHVTLTEGNFAEFAHIVAFREKGPRGRGARPEKINDISNLMLLCPRCHKLIDDHPDTFSRETLEGYKKAHEQRIRLVTGLGPEQKTSIVLVKSRIGDQTVTVPFDQILSAITPRYPLSKDGLPIDLTQMPTDSGGFISVACDTIREQLQGFMAAGGEVKRSNHISLFALAPMPVLAFLGTQLSNKVPLDLYQRHRDTDDWNWKKSGKAVRYALRKRQSGTKGGGVALLLSLSGAINRRSLPVEITGDFTIYELTLANSVPRPTFLQQKKDLEEFRNKYQFVIATIARNHPHIREIDFFPAVPAPIAVLCGRELLPKAHPALRIYDYDKNRGGFVYQLSINN